MQRVWKVVKQKITTCSFKRQTLHFTVLYYRQKQSEREKNESPQLRTAPHHCSDSDVIFRPFSFSVHMINIVFFISGCWTGSWPALTSPLVMFYSLCLCLLYVICCDRSDSCLLLFVTVHEDQNYSSLWGLIKFTNVFSSWSFLMSGLWREYNDLRSFISESVDSHRSRG